MSKILITSTHGSEDPTRAGLPFVVAKGAVEGGHQVSPALVGEGALVMKQPIRESILPVGLPPLKDLFQFRPCSVRPDRLEGHVEV